MPEFKVILYEKKNGRYEGKTGIFFAENCADTYSLKTVVYSWEGGGML